MYGCVWTNKFMMNTSLHLNLYSQAYHFYQYYLSLYPNNTADRHEYWAGTVKMSVLVGTDPGNLPQTTHYILMSNGAGDFEIQNYLGLFLLTHCILMSNGAGDFEIQATTSSQGAWWLNVWIFTSAYCESLMTILHYYIITLNKYLSL